MVRRVLLMLCALLLAGTGGCAAAPAGSDEDLVDDWAMLAPAKVLEPAPGDCWKTNAGNFTEVVEYADLTPVACTADHQAETVHVGQLTGPLATAATVPDRKALAALYPECEAAAKTYLGADWPAGLVSLSLHPPTAAQWRGGARFFHCDVVALQSQAGRVVTRAEPFKDSLRPTGRLALTCGNQTRDGDRFTDVTAVPCTQPHDSELVGWITRHDVPTWPATPTAMAALVDKQCDDQLYGYTGMTPNNLTNQAVYSIYWPASNKTGWEAGNHTARCYLMLDKKITRSLKAAGNITI